MLYLYAMRERESLEGQRDLVLVLRHAAGFFERQICSGDTILRIDAENQKKLGIGFAR